MITVRTKIVVFIFLLTACAGGEPVIFSSQTPGEVTPLTGPTPTASETRTTVLEVSSVSTGTDTPRPSLTPSLAPGAWMSLPVVPTGISQRVLEIYQHGQELGNLTNAFSKVGDCDATPTWFLGDFDLGPAYYSLGEYDSLQPVIDNFLGSFGRTSAAVGRGFTAASVLTPLWADPNLCVVGESPLACEVRLNRPSFALVMLGTNDISRPETFEANMRQVLDFLIQNGVVPILATKADNLEGDNSINFSIARLANEYQIPLWNFWLVVQPLPNHGLQADGAHLTFASNHFDDPVRMQAAWPWRNLTALQVLDVVWQGILSGQ